MLSRIRVFGLVVALLSGLSSSSRAQTPTATPAPVQMVLSSPFAAVPKPLRVMARNGKWVPIAVSLSNSGEPVSGQVELRLSTSYGGSFDYAPNVITADVELPTNSSKRIWLYARLDRPNVDGLAVSFSGRGFSRLSEQVSVSQPDSTQKEILVVTDTDIGLNDTLRSIKTQASVYQGVSPTPSVLRMGVTPLLPFAFPKELVPDRWIGFQGADMVVLGDFPHIALSPTQIDALRGYVQGGGTLVVLGGAYASRLSSSPLKDLWPVVPTTYGPASQTEVNDIVRKYVGVPQNGADRLGGASVVILQGKLTPDASLVEGSNSRPLITEREEGAGRVLFLSYDPSLPPFVGWKGQGALWSSLIKHIVKINDIDTVDANFLTAGMTNFSGGFNGNPPNYSNGEDDTSTATGRLLGSLSHAEQLTMPPVSRIAWFLALYVFFLVPVNYAVLRIIDRRELAWVTIPVIVVAFSVWAYSEALSIRGRAILTRQIDIVQSSIGSKKGRVDSLFWLFSPRRTTYDISAQGQAAALCDYAYQNGGEQGNFTLSQPPDGSSFKIEGAPLRMWTDRDFASQSLGDLKQGLSLSGNALKNDTGTDLKGAVWVQDGRVVGVGTLKNGASVTLVKSSGKKFNSDIVGEILRASHLEGVFDRSSLANNIPQSALSVALGEGFGRLNETPVLIGWGEKSIAPFSIGDDNGQGRQITLYVFRTPASKLPTQLAAREAIMQRVSFEPFTPSANPSQGGFAYFDAYVNGSTSRPKDVMVSARGTGASLFISRNFGFREVVASGVKKNTSLKKMALFEVWDGQTSRWRKVTGNMRIDPSPAGGWNFDTPLSARYISHPDNTLRIRIRLENAGINVSTVSVES